MKRFQFSLETVLAFRHNTERKSAIALSEAVKSVTSIDIKIKEQKKRIENIFAKTGDTLEFMRLRENIWHTSINQIKRLEAGRETAVRELEKAQSNYNQAYRDKQILELLSQKRKSEWNKRKQKAQEKTLDDIGIRTISNIHCSNERK